MPLENTMTPTLHTLARLFNTLAILTAFQYSPILNEAVADAFRALALLKSDEPLAPDRLFRIADELDP
jgi:hypothetical protein